MTSVRTPELEDAVLEGLAEGEGLLAISKRLGVARRTIRSWEEQDREFAARVRVARAHGYAVWADEIISIGDEVEGCTDNAVVQAARTRIDARKWLLGKLNPQQYGDRVELTGKDGRDLLASPEAQIPRLMAVLSVVLPGAGNSELHELATAMAGKLKQLEGPQTGPGTGNGTTD